MTHPCAGTKPRTRPWPLLMQRWCATVYSSASSSTSPASSTRSSAKAGRSSRRSKASSPRPRTGPTACRSRTTTRRTTSRTRNSSSAPTLMPRPKRTARTIRPSCPCSAFPAGRRRTVKPSTLWLPTNGSYRPSSSRLTSTLLSASTATSSASTHRYRVSAWPVAVSCRCPARRSSSTRLSPLPREKRTPSCSSCRLMTR